MSREIKKQGGPSSFLDPFFEPFRRKSVPPSKSIGVSGTAAFGGFIETHERDSRLQGRERYKTFSDILVNTSIAGAGLRHFLNMTTNAGWKVEPTDDSSKALELAEAVEDILFDMATPWHRVVRRAAMFRPYGYSIQAWTATRLDDGTIGFLDVAPRPQITIERWDLDEDGNVHGVFQRSPQTQEEIYVPRARMVYVVDDSLNDSPEGLGLFRHLVEPTRRLKRYEQLEGWGFETDLRGTPIGRGPFQALQEMVDRNDISAEQKLKYEAGLRNFVTNHVKTPQRGLLLDSRTYETTDDKQSPSAVRQWDIELLQASSTSQEAVAKAIDRINKEIARVIGVENMMLGATGEGSQALSRDKSENFALAVKSTLRELGEQFEADLVKPLFEMNGWDMDLRPKLKTDAVQFRDIEQITGALRDVAAAASAVGPQDEAFGEVFDLLGLTRPDIREREIDLGLGGMPGQDPTDPETPEAANAETAEDVDADTPEVQTKEDDEEQ